MENIEQPYELIQKQNQNNQTLMSIFFFFLL